MAAVTASTGLQPLAVCGRHVSSLGRQHVEGRDRSSARAYLQRGSSPFPCVEVLELKAANRRRRCQTAVRALFSDGGGDETKKEKKKFINKEQEPEDYWKTTAEKEGKNPMQTLLPYVAIVGLLTPFIILGIAFSLGYIKTPAR